MYLFSKGQKKKYRDSLGRVEELIEKASKIPNIVPLVKTVDEYKGKVFAADVVSTKSEKDWKFLRNVSNDSSYISINEYFGDDTPKRLHKESMD